MERVPNKVKTMINYLKALGAVRVAQEHEKQLIMALQKNEKLDEIVKAIEEDIEFAINNK